MKTNTPWMAFAIVALGATIFLGGCGEGVSEPVRSSADASAAQLKALENNPNIPADQKAGIKERLDQQKLMDDMLSKKGK